MHFHSFKRWRPLTVIFINCLYLKATVDAFNIMEKEAPVFTGGNLRDSFFGYTVGIHSDENSNKWIFVGAPRDNDTTLRDIDRPGVLYKCQINNALCQSITVDADTSPENITAAGEFRYLNPGKNSQWLGGAMDINKGNIFVCAHRWYNKQINIGTRKDHFFQNGICYESAASKSDTWGKYPLLTLKDKNTEINAHQNKYYYSWGFGSLGISVHFIGTEYADVLIGTPGVHSWTGGFVRLRQYHPIYSENNIFPKDTAELIGYAMSSGKYFGGNEIYLAAGGPRLNLTGTVLFFKMTDTSYDVNQPFLTLNGDENGQMSQIGGYFGSALSSVDVNQDKCDDLLVGAPMFASKMSSSVEEGRVFVYLGSPVVGLFKLQMSLLKGSDTPRARFGTAIASLGDINKDSYADIAIGAPFEDDDVGAVYIYNGYKDGLWNKFTQRISGKAVQPGLKGFGISFSRSQDINDDKMVDVAVGAFLSGNVVLLQSQPVIQLSGEIELHYGQISTVLNLQSLNNCTVNTSRLYPCFEFEIKFTSMVSQVIQTIVLNVSARVDTLKEQQRFSFFKNNNETLEATFSLTVEQGTNYRTPGVKVLVKSTFDLVTPIRFYATYELQNYTLFKLPQRPLQPVLNIFDGAQAKEPTKTIMKEIEFQKDCLNNDCKTDLHLSVKPDVNNESEVFIDELEFLKLNVSITKTGDPAYGTSLTIIFPKSFKYKNVDKIKGDTDIQCSFKTEELKTKGVDAFITRSRNASATNETVLICSYGNPMRKDDGVEFQIVLVPSVYIETNFHFYFNATSQSKENLLADNTFKISLFGKKKVVTTFKGVSRPDSVSMGEGRNTYEVKHLFDLHNQGPSLLPEALMYLKYPYVTINEKVYLRLLGKPNVNYTQGSSVSCEEIVMTSNTTTATGDIHVSHDVKHSDCSIDNCRGYKCLIKTIPPRTSAVVDLTLEINIGLLKVLHQNKSFSSTATVIIPNSTNMVLNTFQHTTEIRTRLKQVVPPPEPVAWWIILVSVLAGILIIVILILILWKCGFFKRKKMEEMKQRKSKEADIHAKHIEEVNQETNDLVNSEEVEHEKGDEANITETDVLAINQENKDVRKDAVKATENKDV